MLKAIKLNFITPVHFGRGRDELDKTELFYHSDSLKSALYAVGLPYINQWNDEKNFFNQFRISSCFPFAKNDFFLPKPQLKKTIDFSNIQDDNIAKKVKKIEYFEISVFEELINGRNELISINESHISPDGVFVCKNEDTFTDTDALGNKIRKTFFKTEVQQRVSVQKEWETDESMPFYIDRIYFEENCGLYFIAEFDNPQIEEQVYHALKLLGENGIGTDRTVGNGLFLFNKENDVSDILIKTNQNSNTYLMLGLYLPTEEEHQAINFDESAWGLLKRGGFMAGSENEDFKHLRRKSVYMFTEGSLFNSDIKLLGKYEDLAPEWNSGKMHPVWRDGQCLMLKI